MKRNRQNSGATLVEVMVTLIIASSFFVALLTIYTYGIEQYNTISMKYKMYEETAWVLEQMEEIIWFASSAEIGNSILTVNVPELASVGKDSSEIEFYINGRDHTLRMNDRRHGFNNFNQQILPVASRQRIRRFGARRLAYRVIDAQYEFADNYGYSIKIDLTVEDLTAEDDEDAEVKSLKISTIAFMENRI